MKPAPHSPQNNLHRATADEPVIDSRLLFQHGNTVHIDHAGQRYILRLTRENKLILTK